MNPITNAIHTLLQQQTNPTLHAGIITLNNHTLTLHDDHIHITKQENKKGPGGTVIILHPKAKIPIANPNLIPLILKHTKAKKLRGGTNQKPKE